MITYKTGNILDADAEMLVNTVNAVGVMGKGIALQFKNTFPENFSAYKKAVSEGKVRPGKVFIVNINAIGKVKYIANFATKNHWRYPSKLEWIESGLRDLKDQIVRLQVESVALPPLGCGHGGLDWNKIKPLIEHNLSNLPVKILAYEPSDAIKEILKNEFQPKAARLTPARAMLIYLLYKYRASGEEVTEFAAEKLSYFLQELGEKQLKLDFQKSYYGPYSGKIRHVLFAMNGYYLKGFEQKEAKPFEPLRLVAEKKQEVEHFVKNNLSQTEINRLDRVVDLIFGFESTYGLELLASVNYLISQGVGADAESVFREMESWSERKRNMFSKEHIELAIQTLNEKLS